MLFGIRKDIQNSLSRGRVEPLLTMAGRLPFLRRFVVLPHFLGFRGRHDDGQNSVGKGLPKIWVRIARQQNLVTIIDRIGQEETFNNVDQYRAGLRGQVGIEQSQQPGKIFVTHQWWMERSQARTVLRSLNRMTQ